MATKRSFGTNGSKIKCSATGGSKNRNRPNRFDIWCTKLWSNLVSLGKIADSVNEVLSKFSDAAVKVWLIWEFVKRFHL